MNENKFFDETTEQSEVKSKIVSKYFWAWAKVIVKGLIENKRKNEALF